MEKNFDDEEFDDEDFDEDSDFDVVAEELDRIAELEAEYIETRDPQCLITVARSYNSLAEVFLESEESYTSDYYLYKKKAAEKYNQIWEITEQPNALLFAALFYECANEHGKAAEALKTIKKNLSTGDVLFFLDRKVLDIVDTLINGSVKKAERMITINADSLDTIALKEIRGTYTYLLHKEQEKKAKKERKSGEGSNQKGSKKRWKINLPKKKENN